MCAFMTHFPSTYLSQGPGIHKEMHTVPTQKHLTKWGKTSPTGEQPLSGMGVARGVSRVGPRAAEGAACWVLAGGGGMPKGKHAGI